SNTFSRTSDATSVDSIPRFRTVHSWVNQQTSRIEQAQARKVAVTEQPVPEIPASYMNTTAKARRETRIIKGASTEMATVFEMHPGDEVVYKGTSRIPSEVLDAKFGRI